MNILMSREKPLKPNLHFQVPINNIQAKNDTFRSPEITLEAKLTLPGLHKKSSTKWTLSDELFQALGKTFETKMNTSKPLKKSSKQQSTLSGPREFLDITSTRYSFAFSLLLISLLEEHLSETKSAHSF